MPEMPLDGKGNDRSTPSTTPLVAQDKGLAVESKTKENLLDDKGDESSATSTAERPHSAQEKVPAEESRTEEVPEDEKGDESLPPMTPEEDYPRAWKLFTIMASLMLAVFCVALDNTVCSLSCIPLIAQA